jgi:OmpA family
MTNKHNDKNLLKKSCIWLVFVIFLLSFTSVSFSQDCVKKLGALPSLVFKSKSVLLVRDIKLMLATVAAKLRNSPGCKIVVIGYCSTNKKEQQRSWDRVNAVITWLVEKEGISPDRFIFNYGQEGGDCNTVDLRTAAPGEDGPSTVAPPHPNLSKKNN